MALLKTDQTPWKVVPLKFCTVSFYRHWVWTQFHDGEGYGGFPDYEPEMPFFPNYTKEYREAAKLTGTSDPMVYCLVHDFCHSFVMERVWNHPSKTLWALAHGLPIHPMNPFEEALVMAFQFHLNGGPMFATGENIDWIKIRSDAEKLLT